MDKPIITSLLDLDKYKITMGQIVHDLHPNVEVEYTFTNRTKDINLARYINLGELKEQIEHIKNLRFTYDELTYLRNQPEFKQEFINHLATQKYDVDFQISLEDNGNQIGIKFIGRWEVAILYETLILSIINEMFGKVIVNGLDRNIYRSLRVNGLKQLKSKLDLIKEYPSIKFIEFGTRRRHSFDWQQDVIAACTHYTNNFIGTSNYLMAKTFDIKPIGTQAHEWFMVRAAIQTDVTIGLPKINTQRHSINAWWDYYKQPLSIILTDTFGTNNFLEHFDCPLAENCLGVRHDSGDPIAFGNKMIAFYKKLGIDPLKKSIVFSDGLDVDTIIKLYKEFGHQIGVTFGWGTNLTNDLGIKPLSIVIKATGANGNPTVKLSDNINKATGPKGHVAEYIRLFKPEQINEETIY